MTEFGFPKAFPRLETARLILREVTRDDASAIFGNFSDPDVSKWFLERPFTDMEQAIQIIDDFRGAYAQGSGLTWAITLKEDATCIGTCGYGEAGGVLGEIGFDLAKEQWGKGLMTEALVAAVDYGFARLNLAEIGAHTYSGNSRAIRLLHRLGFQVDTISEDSHYFSLSREDWERSRH